MRKVFLDDLPRHKKGKLKGYIDWNNCIGKEISFIYENYSGIFKIISYNNTKLCIEYNQKIFQLYTGDIIATRIARVIGYTKQSPHKYNIDDKIGEKRIINRYRLKIGKDEITKKFYDCQCLLCGDILLKIEECNIHKNQYCYGCHNIEKTHPDIAKLIIGDCKGLTHNDKVVWKCPHCNQLNNSFLGSLIKKEKLPCKYCSDGFSYGEKIFNNAMRQISNTYESRKKFIWSGGKEYDGFDKDIFMEIHGAQHYKNDFSAIGGRTVEEEQENDKFKELLAWKYHKNIIDYIAIRADKTDFDYIKNNIMNSRLNKYYDLSCINWNEIHNIVNGTSLVHDVVENYNLGYTLSEIATKFNISVETVRRYIKRGEEIGLCKYLPYRKLIRCVNNGQIFTSSKEAARWCGLKSVSGINRCIQNQSKYKTAGVHPITGERLKWEMVT